MATLEAIINILSDLEQEDIILSAYGNEKGEGTLTREHIGKTLEDRVRDFDLNEIQEAVDEIPKLWKKSNRINYRNTLWDETSYGKIFMWLHLERKFYHCNDIVRIQR